MLESKAIVFFSEGATTAEYAKRAERAHERLLPLALQIVDELGVEILLDTFISMWLDMHLKLAGVEETDKVLRRLRRDVPKMAAVLRAAQSEDAGHA